MSHTALPAILVICATYGAQVELAPETKALEARRRTTQYLSEVLNATAHSEMVEVGFEALPKALKYEMYNSMALVFEWEAHPQPRGGLGALSSGKLDVRVHAARTEGETDLIEYTWEFAGEPLRFLRSQDVARLDIDLNAIRENPELDRFGSDIVERVKGLISSVLKLQGTDVYGIEYSVEIPWPDELSEGVTFTSNPDRSHHAMDAAQWHERVDGLVESDTLSLLFNMKPGKLAFFRDGSKWFPDDFRQLVHERAQ